MPDWSKFEKTVSKIQEALSPEAKVQHNEKIIGKSGRKRQIDVTLRQKIGHHEILIAVECKDLSRKVDIKGIEEAEGLFDDVQAHKKVIVSAKGFTNSAIRRAESFDISLYRLIDTNRNDRILDAIRIPAIIRLHRLQSFDFVVTCSSPMPLTVSFPIPLNKVYDKHHKEIGSFFDVLSRWWDNNGMNMKQGAYEDVNIIDDMHYCKTGPFFTEVCLQSSLDIVNELFLAKLKVKNLVGLAAIDRNTKDASSHNILGPSFSLEVPFSHPLAFEQYEKINSLDDLPNKPSLRLELLFGINPEDYFN